MLPLLNERRKAFTAVVERYWPVKVAPRNWPSPTLKNVASPVSSVTAELLRLTG
jgi:hypothetical protein